MQFVKSGPDIPESLLQAHEDGRVIFFCGAGISYPAGLPGFQGLVDNIYTRLGTTRDPTEDQVYFKGQYDATLDLLERRYPGRRIAVRKALMDILKPKLRRKGATETHSALLQLARSRSGAVRIVTTNFDRIFERQKLLFRPQIESYRAPLLPIPKSSRWDGIVYLHGLLPKDVCESDLQKIVVTSGDFGLAYLTERWAARFVSELFRNFIVCFVGYSINDPVLRYMMDAIAADQMLGEITLPTYALGEFASGQQEEKRREWEAKNVVPLLYEMAPSPERHSPLHRTLKTWANTYRDGVRGRERIVVDYAITRPLESTAQDDYVGRMLWALTDRSGLPARIFADFNPVPSLDWLEPLCSNRYRHGDLSRFGVPTDLQSDEKLSFSLLLRPAPYTHAPWMALTIDSRGSEWDEIMFQMARWLTRHLNDPALILWLSADERMPSDVFGRLIEDKLSQIGLLEQEGKIEELDKIRLSGPNSIPHKSMRIIWRLLLTGRTQITTNAPHFFRWIACFKHEGMTTLLRLQLRDLLTPKVRFSPKFRWSTEMDITKTPEKVKDFLDFELVLRANDLSSFVDDLTLSEAWRAELPKLFDDFQRLLLDALDLMRELGTANDRSDEVSWHMPSISPHWQNRRFHEWLVLVEFLRDSWKATLEIDVKKAGLLAQNWFGFPYPTFIRLALYAATFDRVIPGNDWVTCLLNNDGWWLWSPQTIRETMRLLVLQARELRKPLLIRLEAAILAGPPRAMYRDEIQPEEWTKLVSYGIWIRLRKLQAGGLSLSKDAISRLKEVSAKYSSWKLQDDESDEFSHWMSGTGDPGHGDRVTIDLAPLRRRDLMTWLRKQAPSGPMHEDNWRSTCIEHFPIAASALFALAYENFWPESRWRDALYAWSTDQYVKLAWRWIGPTLQRMPEPQLLALADPVAWLLASAATIVDENVEVFYSICWRVLGMPFENRSTEGRPVNVAINHPIGHVTDGLFKIWFRRKPNDNEGLPTEFKQILTLLCDTKHLHYRPGRVLISTYTIALFRVDQQWTNTFLLPLFVWQKSAEEAQGAWAGFLWSPRIYKPLLRELKTSFLSTAHHYSDLTEHAENYASLLTYIALDPADTFTTAELADATNALPESGLFSCAQALVNALEGAGEKRAEQWNNRIEPYWQSIWPKSLNLVSQQISEQLARLPISAGEAFPSALITVINWLKPFEHLHFIIGLLKNSGICSNFPKEALNFLSVIISDQRWMPTDLSICLSDIKNAWPAAVEDDHFQRIENLIRRRGN